jgi:hypothetical protein
MSQYLITIPEKEEASFTQLMEQHGYAYSPADAPDAVPEWQQELVLNRLANTRPDDYIQYEALRAELLGLKASRQK